jgi:hydroxymethylbilane synthase
LEEILWAARRQPAGSSRHRRADAAPLATEKHFRFGMTRVLRLGTRGSALALWQAHFVANRLRETEPDVTVELVEIETSGDVIRDAPLAQIGGQGIFTKEIQRALQDGRIDIAVHSLKDLPTNAVENLVLAAVPPRGPTGDALVSRKHASFAALPGGATVATSSQRRRSQVLHRRPDLTLVEIRGNVDTRLRKLVEQDLDALVLAEAGLIRLGRNADITEVLDAAWMLPAVGQGALGIECRADDASTLAVVKRLNDPVAYQCVLAERALLRELGGGCQIPIGAATSVHGDRLSLRGVVLSPDGRQRVEDAQEDVSGEAEAIGSRVAQKLLARGAAELLKDINVE